MHRFFISNANLRGVFVVIFSAILSVTLLAAIVQGATTISTNIQTDGTLSVTGASTLTGAATLSSTISVTGLATLLGGATTTTLTLLNGEVISNATDGTIQLAGIASTTSITLLNGETITNATDGTITLGATNVVLVGTASTSAIRVGDEPAAPVINGLVFGYCSFGDTAITASTTAYVDCTSSVTGALTTSDRVFVMATSSLDNAFIIQAASSTGVSTINLKVFNTGIGTADGTLGGTSVNFWAVR